MKEEWLCVTAMARRMNMDLRCAKRFLATANIRCRKLPGLKDAWSISHALEVISAAEARTKEVSE